jgi:uncharacterized membrane protein
MRHAPDLRVPRARMEALTDGVYAFAVTLLVLELHLPELPPHAVSPDLARALVAQLPKLSVWLLSFWVIATFWTWNAGLMRVAADDTVRSMKIELCQLALISLMPFSTSVMARYGDLTVASALYSGHLLALSLLSLARLATAFPSDVAAGRPGDYAGLRRPLLIRAWFSTGCMAAALLLAFIVPSWNMLALLPLVFRSLVSRMGRAERLGSGGRQRG